MLGKTLNYEAICYEAEITVDLILSFPWMARHKIGVFPHHKALVVDGPKFLLLYGQQEKRKKVTG